MRISLQAKAPLPGAIAFYTNTRTKVEVQHSLLGILGPSGLHWESSHKPSMPFTLILEPEMAGEPTNYRFLFPLYSSSPLQKL